MNRHDAHEIAFSGRKRARSLLGSSDAIGHRGRHASDAAAELGSEAGCETHGLERVARTCDAFGALAFKARQPA